MRDLHVVLQSDGERAVSPVVAVILVVAITVALSASVGLYVLQFGEQSTSDNSRAGVSVAGDTIQLVDEGNVDRIEIRDESGDTIDDGELTSVGDSKTVPSGNYTIVGISEDGKETVLQQATVSDSATSANFDTSGSSITVSGS